ncbi:MAG TPA: hypothetical protein GX521_01920 [Firmicutes bacterium]|nr:hypothetical protein [Bacillota bacterium]
MSEMNLLVLIDQLEILIEQATEVPLIGKILLDGDELFDLVDVIRAAIPREIKRAEAVSSEREKMISESQLQAERIIAKAEEYAGKLVRNSEVYRQAQEESKRLLQESERRAKEIEDGAREYAQGIFANLHTALERTLTVVEKSQEELAKED